MRLHCNLCTRELIPTIDCNAVMQKIKGTNSNLVDCNAVAHNIKGTNSSLVDCNAVVQNIKGTNSNVVDCNAVWCSGRVSSCSTCDTRRVTLITKICWLINEETTGLWLQQTGHICGHLWNRYSVISSHCGDEYCRRMMIFHVWLDTNCGVCRVEYCSGDILCLISD